MQTLPKRVYLHIRPVTAEDAPKVVARAGTRLISAGRGDRARMMMRTPLFQQRARELLENAYRDDPSVARQRAIDLAAKALASQVEQFSP